MAAGRIVVPPYFPARNRDFDLLSGAKLYVYLNETTTKALIYTDEALTVLSANPVIANSSGQFPAVYAEAGTEASPVLYSVSVTTSTGASPGNPFNFDNYRPSVDWETAAVALAEAAAEVAVAAADSAAADAVETAADLAAIEAIIVDAPDAPSVLNKLNRNGDNVGSYAAVLRGNIGATATGDAVFTAASPEVGRYALNVQANNIFSLLNVLTSAERADVLAGTNAIDITTKFATLVSTLATSFPGAILDASMVWGTWTWTSDPFNPGGELGSAPITVRLGAVTVKKNFNDGPVVLPSYFTLETTAKTKIAPTIKIDTIPGDSAPANGMLITHLVGSNGLSGTNGSPVVTLDFSYAGRVNVGACFAIFGVEPFTQNAVAISGAINSSVTTITFASDMTAEMEGLTYIKIDNEIIKGSVSGTTMTGCTRGANGTTAASHADAATATQMISRIYTVVAKSGTSVTLDAALDRNLTAATWRCGSIDTRIVGPGLIDGELNRASPASGNWMCVGSTLSRRFQMDEGLRLIRADHGGFMLMGCREARIDLPQIAGCGMPGSSLGSSFWLFGDVSGCTVNVDNLDDGSLGLAIDNKSFGVPEYGLISSCENNVVTVGSITNHVKSYNLSATFDNEVWIGVNKADSGVLEDSASQLVTPIPCTGNSVVVGSQPNAAGVAVDNPEDNYIVINGKSRREVTTQITTGSILYVPFNVNLSVTASFTGARSGDEVTVLTAAQIPALIGVMGSCYTDDVVTLLFLTQSDGTKEVPIGTVLNITARGPW